MSIDALRLEQARKARPNGWWGMAVFVATEATLFGTILGTYVYLRFRVPRWPPPGVPEPDVLVPVALTCVLVATSVPIGLASRAAARMRARATWWWLAAATLVQAGFFAMQIRLFVDDLARFTPRGSAYGSIYYTLLGAHQFHVAVGLLLDVWLLVRLLGGLTRYRAVGVRATAFYWHFVNAVAVLVLLAEISPRL